MSMNGVLTQIYSKILKSTQLILKYIKYPAQPNLTLLLKIAEYHTQLDNQSFKIDTYFECIAYVTEYILTE
jgi:hypothetical protein